jgi:hypothetical protein
MERRGFKPEQIIHMLREAEVRLAGGSTVGEVCRALNILEGTSGSLSALRSKTPSINY